MTVLISLTHLAKNSLGLVIILSILHVVKRRPDSPIDDGTKAYVENVKLAVKTTFFVPRGLQKQSQSLIPPVPPPHRDSAVVALPQARGDGNDLEGQDPSDVNPKDGGVPGEKHSDLDAKFGDPNCD
ncbi:hypothetical protein BDM02DRAFT_3190945 [Thelephora ganbajun]|uniref:Uncharacterized protein n=1 Tax=Thelephora ganbajun TaxID=370292 RepID=A0ACB6Z4G1_THEGA|nr:hypothetical protein BDM02DRAFT_3190945 [Thelephora ganbajun]